MKLVVVTVNYGAAQHVLKSLEQLVPQLRQLGDAEAWVVDNRSPDDSVAVLREGIAARGLGDRARLIESPVNGGFGAGNNVAFRQAMASADPPELFYLLNPDAIPDAGCVAALVAFMDQHPEVGIAGGRLRSPDGADQPSTFRFPTLWSEIESNLRLGVVSRLLHERIVHMSPPPAHNRAVDWVSGASMVIRRRVLEQVGLFDEQFFLYFEEVDLCRRVRDAGHEIWFVREAAVEHVGGLTTGVQDRSRRMPRYWFESRAHYLRKSMGDSGLQLSNVLAATCFSLHRARQALGGRRQENPHFLRDFVKFNFLPGAPKPPRGGPR